MAEAFPAEPSEKKDSGTFHINDDPYDVTKRFGIESKTSLFRNAGVMQGGVVFSERVEATYTGEKTVLGDILVPPQDVPPQFWIDEDSLPKWSYLKGAKKERREAKSGFEYTYAEGPVTFPDPLDQPSRTILTGEGGKGASRMKHVVEQDGRLRRLVPDELDQLQMFPRGWTDDGMSDGHRAFCMGNALVTGIPHRIGKVIAGRLTPGR